MAKVPGRSGKIYCSNLYSSMADWLTLFQVARFEYSHCKNSSSISRVGIISQTKYIALYKHHVRAKIQVHLKRLQIIRPT